MDKKKIAIVTRALYGGGAERVIAQLADYLVSRGDLCVVVTIYEGEVFYQVDPKVELIAIGQRSSNKVIDRIKRYECFRRVLSLRKVDVVLATPETIGIYVLPAMLGTGIPVIVSERNNPWVMPDVKITRILRRIFYPFASGFIFQTEMAKSFFSKRIQKKGVVLPNPVDATRIPKQYEGMRKKTIVGAGRLHPQKNFDLLIDAFAGFYEQHGEYELVIYGEGPMRKALTEHITKLGLQSHIHLPGRSGRLLEEMKDCALFVLSSDYEGSPNVLIEAMCMGMPVVSTDCPSGGSKELIENGVNGLLVPVRDKKALQIAMEKMCDDETAKSMADRAYKMREKLTSEEIFEEWRKALSTPGLKRQR